MVEKNILIKYFNERTFVYYNNEKGISSIRWKLNDRGKKRIEEFKKELKEYAKNHDYAKFNKEVTWIENFKVNTSNENNTLWVTDFLSSEDEIDYHMLKKDYVGYSVGIVSPDGDSLDYNLNASWTAFRGDTHSGGNFWKLDISIPIIDILYKSRSWRKIFIDIEMGEYDN